jgi:hypothetical protein
MRLRALGAAVAIVGLLAGGAGCSRDSAKSSAPPSGNEPLAPTLPAQTTGTTQGPSTDADTEAPPRAAAAAGGACAKITFTEVATATGTSFHVAAASGGDNARSCVLQKIGAATPDLTFTILPAAGLTVADYKADLVPGGSAPVAKLGQAAYTRVVAPAAGAGPRAEIGWLGTGRTYTLAYTTPRGTSAVSARAYLPKLVQLAPRLLS